MAKLFIGTCSWKYNSWRGIVYPDNPKLNFLKEYTKHYNTVEIDQWFWSLFGVNKIMLPNPKDVIAYKSSVPENFKFSVKVPNSITLTHFYKKKKDDPLEKNPHFLSVELFEHFIKSLEPLKQNLGPLIFQFEYLNQQKMSTQFDFQIQFTEFIKNCPPDFEYAVESRNPNYINKTYFEFLAENNLIPVFMEGYYMPSIVNIFKTNKTLLKNQTVLRLHGTDRKGIENKTSGDWSKIVSPRDDSIYAIADMIRELLSKEIDVYLNVNNHFEGSAPLTINKFKKLLTEK